MHVANGLDVPAVIVYGGRETPSNSGYRENINLYAKTACSPCWLHDSHGDVCPYDMECMKRITAAEVVAASREILAGRRPT
jgi:ADP-heptose:LPS heptosyltransferase